MKKMIFLFVFIFNLGPAVCYSAAPVLFFSDLVSGPKTGGKDNKGVWVTIKGVYFGTARGAGYVSIGGGTADNYVLWTSSKIIFQLGANASTGNITVTTAEGTSNGLPFTVRSGRIFFIDAASPNNPGTGSYSDPWRSPASYYSAMAPGDTGYVRAGTYSGKYGNPNAHFNLGWGYDTPNGAAGNEIAWVGYPNEAVKFEALTTDVNGCFSWDYSRDNYIVAGFILQGSDRGAIRIVGNNNRIINNDCRGNSAFTYALINPAGCNGSKIYGNQLHNLANANKLCHALYIGYGSDNTDFGWNQLYDNNIAEGPMISVNQDNAQTNHDVFQNILIHDNLLECTYGGVVTRAIGVVVVDVGSTISIYNNIIKNSGGDVYWNYCMYRYSGAVKFYNNTIYNSKGSYAIYIDPAYPEPVEARNNIMYNQSNCGYIYIPSGISVSVSNNCYYGNGPGPGQDSNPVNSDPLFVNRAVGDFHLQGNSPCIDRGYNTTSLVQRDFEGNIRPAGSVDIGAYESVGTVVSTTSMIGGYIKDAYNNGLGNVTVNLTGAQARTALTSSDGYYFFNACPDNLGYTVTPVLAAYTFTPRSYSVGSLAGDITNWNFTGSRYFNISGTARDAAGNGISNAAVSMAGKLSRSTVTAGDGSYSFLSCPENSSYTVTAVKTGYTMSPVNYNTMSLTGDITNWNFTGSSSSRYFNISGITRDLAGNGISNAAVTMAGKLSSSTVTAGDGSYSFLSCPENSSYTVTAVKTGYTMSPVSYNTMSLTGDITNWNFTGSRYFNVSGFIHDSLGNSIEGAVVSLSGGVSQPVTSAYDGSYTFQLLPENSSFNVSVNKAGYVFMPPVYTVVSIAGNISGLDFTGTHYFSLSGYLKDASGAPVSGAAVNISGGINNSVMSSADGSYMFNQCPENSSYTIIPSKIKYVFNPQNLTLTNLKSDIANLDFTGKRLYGISGFVMDPVGNRISGVTLNLTDAISFSTATQSNGQYAFDNCLEQLSYTESPASIIYDFSPSSYTTARLINDINDWVFVAMPKKKYYGISGSVRDISGYPLSDTTLSLSGYISGVTVSRPDGSFEFLVCPEGESYTVAPSKPGYIFSPVNSSTGSLSGNISMAFTGTPYYKIGGLIRDINNYPIPAVTVDVTDNVKKTELSLTDGSFLFDFMPGNSAYTVTPTKPGYGFNPASYILTSLTADTLNINFTGTQSYGISGIVCDSRGSGLNGIHVKLTNSILRESVTPADGTFNFPGNQLNLNYSVIPYSDIYGFNPSSYVITNLTKDFNNLLFIGTRIRKAHVRGRVMNISGSGIAGVSMTLADTFTSKIYTGSDGSYVFETTSTNINIIAQSANYTFAPSSFTFTNLNQDINDADFTATEITSTLQELNAGQVIIIGNPERRGRINPDKGDTAKIYFKGNDYGTYTCRIYTLNGKLVWESAMQNAKEGMFEWVPADIQSGTYIVAVRGPGFNRIKKIVIIR